MFNLKMKIFIEIFLVNFLLFFFLESMNCNELKENFSSNKLHETILNKNKLKLSLLKKSENRNLKCGHDSFKNIKITLYDPSSTEDKLFAEFLEIGQARNIPWTPINVYFDYYDLKGKLDKGVINENQYNSIFENMNKIKIILSDLIQVQRLVKKISPKPTSQEDCIWDPKNIKNGINADLAICVTVQNGDFSASAYAYELLKDNFRPIIGLILFNLKSIPNSNKEADSIFIPTALHEITHILGFSQNLFGFFVDKNFKRIPIHKTLKKDITGRTKIISPLVVKAMQNHFGCNTADGLELEDDGKQGTAASHWEERIMYGDYMIGMDSKENGISEITLALLEDSGWYKTNKFTGGLFMFGRKKGCGFLTEKCISEKGTKFKNEFCVNNQEFGCSTNRRWKSICRAEEADVKSVSKSELTNEYKNRKGKNVTLTGLRPYSDTCPLPLIHSSIESNLAFSCFHGIADRDKNGPISFYEKVSGNNNACFLSNVMSKMLSNKQIYNFGPYTSGCYEHICDFDKKIINIKINSKNYECPSRGGIINIDDPYVEGKIVCPDFYFLCNQDVKCDHLVDCVSKKSIRIEEPEMLNFESLANMGSNLVENMNVEQVKGKKF